MSELKTKPTDASAEDFITTIEDAVKREDSITLLELFKRATGQSPKMWGTSIIGFGQYHYKSERSAQEGDWPLVAFSPRKQSLTLYVMPSAGDFDKQFEKLGKFTTSVGCLYIKKLADVDVEVLEELVGRAYEKFKNELT
ncbi:MAG: DUF1801 domain-containing protein [Candidatus Microsaccharimonas sp.]